MGQAGPLRWRKGRGWIILIGGGEMREITEIHRAAIEAMDDESPAVFVPAAGDSPGAGREYGERILARIKELGGPVGYVAPIFTRADAADLKNARRLAQAGLIYLGGGPAQRLVETLPGTPTFDALTAAYQAGAVVVADGEAARALGAWRIGEARGAEMTGWGWLPDALICPHFDLAAPALRAAIQAHSECLGLGIPQGAALALGPENQVQTLSASEKQVTVVLGARFRQPD